MYRMASTVLYRTVLLYPNFDTRAPGAAAARRRFLLAGWLSAAPTDGDAARHGLRGHA